jgi:hypothetical protein
MTSTTSTNEFENMTIPEVVQSGKAGRHEEVRSRFWRREAIDCLHSVGVKNCPESLIDRTADALYKQSLREAEAEKAHLSREDR